MEQNEKVQIASLWIYPVKGMSGIAVDESMVLHKGLQFDRRWMLIDEQNQFLSQRNYPALALCKIKLHEKHFTISYKNETIDVPLAYNGNTLTATVWNDQVSVLELPGGINNTISQWFGKKLKLVHFTESAIRNIDANYTAGHGTTSLSDGFPILLANSASLDILNEQLDNPVAMNRFRPNIIVKGLKSFEEDGLREFKIGSLALKAVKPCARCTVTTIDQETAIAGVEPLRTLATFRKQDHKVLFGMNVIPLNTGLIRVGEMLTSTIN